MAASPLLDQTTQVQQAAPPPTKDQQERSASTPQALKPEQIKSNFGLTPELEQALIEAWDQHRQMWSEERDLRIRRALRAIEYDNGNQFINWDPASGSYLNPFADLLAGSVFDPKVGRVYNKVNNVCQWARKIIVATLTQALPHVEWWPADAESDADNRAAKARTQAYGKIERDNHADELLELAVEHLVNTGSYFRHVYFSMDERTNGTRMEPEIGFQDRQLLPARYSCPSCGQDTMAPPIAAGQEPESVQCQNCGQKLSSAYFYSGVSAQMPVVIGQREVPIGAVRQDLWNLLNVDTMPNVDTSKGNPIIRLPILDLQCEITRGAFRTIYPGAWEDIVNAQPEGGSYDSGTARDARFRSSSPSMAASMAMSDRMPTYHRIWYTEETCRMLDDRVKADELTELVTQDGRYKGVCAVIVNRKVVDIQYSDHVKSWTWCGTKRGSGIFPPSLIEPGLDIQDRINDRINGCDEFHDRMGAGPILYDQTMLGEALDGQFLPPGTLKGVPANRDMARKLEDAFFQPRFTQDNGVYNWIEASLQLFQLLIGCQPQTYGGSDPNIKTKGGQEQALQTAMTILVLVLRQVRRENANAAEISVECLGANLQQSMTSVVRSPDAADFQNEIISLGDLRNGNATAYPEASEGYPISYDEQRELYKELVMAAANNPIIGEVLDSYEAQRLAMRYLGPPDLELPQKPARDKVLRDIAMLVKGQPVQGVDPQLGQPMMMPSVLPDRDVDGPTLATVSIPLTIRYILKNYDLARTNPPVFENLKAYLRLCVQFDRERGQQAALAGAPPQAPATAGAPA